MNNEQMDNHDDNQHQMTFDQIGTLFNKISNQLEGGVTEQNKELLLDEVATVQTQVQGLINAGTLAPLGAVTLVHAQNIADQMNFLTDQINAFGVEPYAPKYLNDVIRDVQDIVAGDAGLSALAHQNNHNGFQQVSNLLTPPTPFADSGAQTTALLQFVADSNSLSARATALAGTDPNSDAIHTLIGDIQNFSSAASIYSDAQGGLFAARFNNEFGLNGVQGTASREIITGLENGDAALVSAGSTVLMANAQDVTGNMLTLNQNFTPAPNGGIPAVIDSVQVAGEVFNDVTTKMIGGVSPANQQSVINDLTSIVAGLHTAETNQNLTGQALKDIHKVEALLTNELSLVSGIHTPQEISHINAVINSDQVKVLNIVHHDATLAALAVADPAAAAGFIALPPTADNHIPPMIIQDHFPMH